MKISKLQELLEKAKEEYGDADIVVKHPDGTSYYYYYEIAHIDEVWYGNGYGYVPAIVVD